MAAKNAPRFALDEIIDGKLPLQHVRDLVDERWNSGNPYDRIDPGVIPGSTTGPDIPWVKVDCMQTKLIGRTADEIGFGLDLFASAAEEKSYMHVHPLGDRICSISEGEGTFLCLREGKLVTRRVLPGDVVFFPRGTPHAFWGGQDTTLLMHVILNPFVPFDHPRHTVKSPEGAQALREAGLLD